MKKFILFITTCVLSYGCSDSIIFDLKDQQGKHKDERTLKIEQSKKTGIMYLLVILRMSLSYLILMIY